MASPETGMRNSRTRRSPHLCVVVSVGTRTVNNRRTSLLPNKIRLGLELLRRRLGIVVFRRPENHHSASITMWYLIKSKPQDK